MNGCGCNKPREYQYEYEITSSTIVNEKECCFGITYESTRKLKDKVICDFLDILNQLECGIKPNLDEINLNIMRIESINICQNKKAGCGFNPNQFLQRANYLSEFSTVNEKSTAVRNLGLYNVEIMTENNYEALEHKLDDTLYFVIPDEEQ